MFKKLGIENFKAFGEYIEIEINDLTLLSGLNSSGKSTIYQAILLLAQSQDKFIEDIYDNRIPLLEINGDLVKLGRAEEILNDNSKGYVRFTIEWDDGVCSDYKYVLRETYESHDSNRKNVNEFHLSCYQLTIDGEVELSVERINDSWTVNAHQSISFGEYEIFKIIDDEIVDNIEKAKSTGVDLSDGISGQGLQKESQDDDFEIDASDHDLSWTFLPTVKFENIEIVDFSKIVLLDFVIKFEDISACVNPIYRDLIDWSGIKEKFEEKNINYNRLVMVNSNQVRHQRYNLSKNHVLSLPPFRGYPRRVYSSDDQENPLALYNYSLDKEIFYEYNFDNNEKVKGTLDEAIEYWLVSHFGIAEKIEVIELIPGLISEIYLTISGERVAINNVGFGASQIVPVIFQMLICNSSKLCIVDEPEIHLHPSIQSKLADFFFKISLTGKKVLLETHSEYLIDKLIYLKLKHEKHSDFSSMYWVNKKGKISDINKIEYDSLGFIINQPDDFLVEKTKLVDMLTEIRMGLL